MKSISEFYKDQEIFITGGTGFIGKVLIEKLLRSCSDLKRIYLLLRSKKGKTACDRLKDILNCPIFDLIKSENPVLLKKLIPIEGDVTEINLNLKVYDLQLLKNVTMIFHVAANVRFDDPLKNAVILNTRGTREVMKFAEKLSNIKVVMHVSTTYCNPYEHIVKEEVYPPLADWKQTIKIAENFDVQLLNILSDKFTRFQPNSYTFSKSLAEQVVDEYKTKLPVLIFRPSIVINTACEPIAGWTDNFNGPSGLLIGSAVGILRTMYGDPNVISDFMPVDVVVKGMIIAGYKQGVIDSKRSDLMVYNCSSSALRSITSGQIIELGKRIVQFSPIQKMLWVPGGSITKCRVYNYIRLVLFHILVAYGVDSIMKFANHKPFLMKLQRRIRAANLALHYFAVTNWTFINNNFVGLECGIPAVDYRSFGFIHYKDIDLESYFINSLKMVKRHLLKESDDTLEKSKIIYRRIYVIDKVLKVVLFAFLLYIVLKYFKICYFLKDI